MAPGPGGAAAIKACRLSLADGFRGGWLEPFQWERAWRGSDLNDEVVLGDARTWLARRPRHPSGFPDQAD